jgi:MFS family permease
VLEHGIGSEPGRAAIKRMNQMHGAYPISNDDKLYVLCTFVTMPIRWLDAYGWRIAFLIGAVVVPFGLVLRRTMPETLHAAETHVAHHVQAERVRGPIRIPRVVLIGLVILGSQTIATYVMNYMTTYAQNSLHMGPQLSFAASLVPNLVNLPAVLFGGWLSDKIGRRPLMIWPMLVRVIVMLPLFYLIVSRPSAASLLGGMAVLGILTGLISGGFYAALTESLAKTNRGQHFALTYSIAIAVFGGTTQPIVTWLIEVTGQPITPGFYLVGSSFLALLAMLAMRETAPVRNPAPLLDLAPA